MLKVTSSRDVANEGFNSSVHLKNAAAQGESRNYDDFMIVDVDAHHYETEAFSEIADYIDDPVLRREAKFQGMARGGSPDLVAFAFELDGFTDRRNMPRHVHCAGKTHNPIQLAIRRGHAGIGQGDSRTTARQCAAGHFTSNFLTG